MVEEAEFIQGVVGELHKPLALDLNQRPSCNRWPDLLPPEIAARKTILVVGSSHAGKRGAALTREGHKVELIFEPNWSIFGNN
jgi:hypothetical protein